MTVIVSEVHSLSLLTHSDGHGSRGKGKNRDFRGKKLVSAFDKIEEGKNAGRSNLMDTFAYSLST